MSRSQGGLPETNAKYSFSIERAANCLAEFGVGDVVSGDQDRAAGVAVEAVDDAGAVQPAGDA